jgi:integrase
MLRGRASALTGRRASCGTFVSLLSDSGVPIEQIADAVGHSSTSTTENVYRHQLRPVLRTAATALGPLFVGRPNGSSGEV